jgi:hypothetical protein
MHVVKQHFTEEIERLKVGILDSTQISFIEYLRAHAVLEFGKRTAMFSQLDYNRLSKQLDDIWYPMLMAQLNRQEKLLEKST